MKNKFSEKKFIIVLFLGSLFIRLLYLSLNIQYIYNDILVNPDSCNYNTIAKNLLQGDGFSLTPKLPTSLFEPIYPIFLSFIYLVFGQSFIFVILFQILFDSMSCVLIYFFTKKLINIEVGILSSIIYIIYPDFIFASCQIMTETLFLFLEIITLSLILKAERDNNKFFYIISGIFCGISVLTKGSFIPFPFLLFFYFLFKKELKKYLIFIFFFFISLSPWIIRNYLVHKSLIIVGLRAGLSFWMGNNEKSNGSWTWIESEKALYEYMEKDGFKKNITEVELNATGFKKGFEYLMSLNFKEFLILKIKKLLFLFDFRYYKHGIMYWYIILFPFAILGIFIYFFKSDKNSILYYILLTPIIISLIFCGDVRFRMPAVPYLNIFSAIGINYLSKKHFNFS